MKKYNYISAAFFIAIGTYVLAETSGYDIEKGGQGNPAIWPQCLAGMMIFLSLILILQTIFSKPQEDGGEGAEDVVKIDWKSPGMKKVYLALAMIAGFIVIMNLFGMLIGLLLLIPSIMWLMNCRNKVMLVVLPVALVAFVYLFFVQLMTITLPGGIFF